MKAGTLMVAVGAAAALATPGAGTAGTGSCARPSKPVVTQLTPTAATFTAAVNPNGAEYVARFRIGTTLTYPVLVGHGHDSVRWQMTVASLQPAKHYLVVAQVRGRGCTSFTSTTFVTPGGARATADPAPDAKADPAARAALDSAPADLDSWNW